MTDEELLFRYRLWVETNENLQNMLRRTGISTLLLGTGMSQRILTMGPEISPQLANMCIWASTITAVIALESGRRRIKNIRRLNKRLKDLDTS
jgi:hypothetical protein